MIDVRNKTDKEVENYFDFYVSFEMDDTKWIYIKDGKTYLLDWFYYQDYKATKNEIKDFYTNNSKFDYVQRGGTDTTWEIVKFTNLRELTVNNINNFSEEVQEYYAVAGEIPVVKKARRREKIEYILN